MQPTHHDPPGGVHHHPLHTEDEQARCPLSAFGSARVGKRTDKLASRATCGRDNPAALRDSESSRANAGR